jgi:hypothetical protein
MNDAGQAVGTQKRRQFRKVLVRRLIKTHGRVIGAGCFVRDITGVFGMAQSWQCRCVVFCRCATSNGMTADGSMRGLARAWARKKLSTTGCKAGKYTPGPSFFVLKLRAWLHACR